MSFPRYFNYSCLALQRDRFLLHGHVNWTRRWRESREIYDAVNHRPVIDIEDISGVRTQGEGQTVEIHDRLEDERISRYTNTCRVPLACGVHANLCSCGRIAGRSWLVAPAIFSAVFLSLCLFNRGVCMRRVCAKLGTLPRWKIISHGYLT